MTNEKPLKLGWIPYYNFRPLMKELSRVQSSEIEIKNGHPAAINRLLAEGSIDLAPCSSVCLAFLPENEMSIPYGMVSKGKVQSVYIGLRHEHQYIYEFIEERTLLLKTLWHSFFLSEDIRTSTDKIWSQLIQLPGAVFLPPQLKLTGNSASSSVLSRLLYIMWFGHRNYLESAEHGRISETPFGTDTSIELLIGDEALERRSQFPFIIDLGQNWWDITGLPFVFAVWQSRGPLGGNPFISKLTKAADLAEIRMKLEPSFYYPEVSPLDHAGRQIALAEYWKHISYRLGQEEFMGLLAFLGLARLFRPVERSDQILLKMVRLQESLGRMNLH